MSLSPIAQFSKNTDAVMKRMNELVKEIFKRLPGDDKKKSVSSKTKTHFDEVYAAYHGISNDETRQRIGDELEKLETGQLLLKYLNILTRDGKKFPIENNEFKNYEVLIKIAWDVSDGSEKFCSQLCKNGIVSFLGKMLKLLQDDYTQSIPKNFAVRSALSVFHNCARRGDNKEFFNEEKDLIDTLIWYVKNTQKKNEICIVSAMVLAEVLEEQYSDLILTDEIIIKKIVNLIGIALEAEDHRVDHGFSATELLDGLSRLANNGKNSQVIVENGILSNIAKMLKVGDDNEKLSAAKALGVFAFCDANKDIILRDDDVLPLLTEISKSTAASTNRELKRTVDAALWIINRFSTTSGGAAAAAAKLVALADVQDLDMRKVSIDGFRTDDGSVFMDEPVISSQAGHIMISYQWSYQELMKRIARRLEEDGYRVWIDVEEMEGSILEAMAEAVEGASVMLVSMARKYKDSFNCRTEAEYAYNLRTRIIPLKVEDHYKADGWLGAMLGTKLYFDFASSEGFEDSYQKLKKEIGETGKMNNNFTEPDTPKPIPPESVPGISTWSSKDANNWLKDNNINKLKQQSLNGKILLFLKKMKKEAPEFYYRCVTDQLGLVDLEDVMNFTCALESLPNH